MLIARNPRAPPALVWASHFLADLQISLEEICGLSASFVSVRRGDISVKAGRDIALKICRHSCFNSQEYYLSLFECSSLLAV